MTTATPPRYSYGDSRFTAPETVPTKLARGARTRRFPAFSALSGAPRVTSATRAVATGLRGLLRRARTPVLTVAGLVLLSAAAWQLGRGWGLAAAGLSCFALEWLTGDEPS